LPPSSRLRVTRRRSSARRARKPLVSGSRASRARSARSAG
jgi:hypothetical protein